jgi:hypothetical protein
MGVSPLPPPTAASSAPLAIKPAGLSTIAVTPLAPGPPTPAIVTRREWVIPPRPKPGRKAATDPPPTKRKAQNRAAQRAFRERRAARVGELEEELDETKEDQQRREAEMRKRIGSLEAEILRFNGELHSWKMRCETLDRIAQYERKEKEAALVELSYLRSGALTTSTDAVPIPPRRLRRRGPNAPPPMRYTTDAPAAETEEHSGCDNCSLTKCACVEQAIAISTSTCGRCSADSRCECLEETIKAASDMPATIELKRAHSPPSQDYTGKRHRPPEPHNSLEVDFTAQFSSKPTQQIHPAQDTQISARPSAESCGFCEDGTYCVCAEAAASVVGAAHETHIQLAPLLNEITPPPSDTDANGNRNKLQTEHPTKMHLSVAAAIPDTCINGPGTCQQCQSDPKSGLFCRSLATLGDFATPTSSAPGGCCGGNDAGGPCCKSLLPAQPTRPPSGLSCADAYKVLSTHEKFDQASDELNSWLGHLQATSAQHAGRAPVEVEAASVMGVLRLFDRRFGKG